MQEQSMCKKPSNTKWVSTCELTFANDSGAASNEYWLCFREAGEELYRAYPRLSELPNVLSEPSNGTPPTWSTPRFSRMQNLYPTVCPSSAPTPQGGLKVLRRYRQMKILRRYLCEPIELTNDGSDDHQILIGKIPVTFSKLDGNHRLMSAFFLGLDKVPVILPTSTACQTSGEEVPT